MEDAMETQLEQLVRAALSSLLETSGEAALAEVYAVMSRKRNHFIGLLEDRIREAFEDNGIIITYDYDGNIEVDEETRKIILDGVDRLTAKRRK